MAQHLIGMIGKKRSGKDTFAHGLTGYTRVAFADPLRQAALALDPYVGRPALPGHLAPIREVRLSEVVEAIGWEAAKDYVPEVRRILQRLGTESIRALDPEFWIRAGMAKAGSIDGDVVVTDCRYPNEAQAIKDAGGYLIRVVRPGQVDDGDAHPSESALDDWDADFIVFNDGTVEHLQDVAAYVAQLVADDVF